MNYALTIKHLSKVSLLIICFLLFRYLASTIFGQVDIEFFLLIDLSLFFSLIWTIAEGSHKKLFHTLCHLGFHPWHGVKGPLAINTFLFFLFFIWQSLMSDPLSTTELVIDCVNSEPQILICHRKKAQRSDLEGCKKMNIKIFPHLCIDKQLEQEKMSKIIPKLIFPSSHSIQQKIFISKELKNPLHNSEDQKDWLIPPIVRQLYAHKNIDLESTNYAVFYSLQSNADDLILKRVQFFIKLFWLLLISLSCMFYERFFYVSFILVFFSAMISLIHYIY